MICKGGILDGQRKAGSCGESSMATVSGRTAIRTAPALIGGGAVLITKAATVVVSAVDRTIVRMTARDRTALYRAKRATTIVANAVLVRIAAISDTIVAVMAGNRATLYWTDSIAGGSCLCLRDRLLIDCAAVVAGTTVVMVGGGWNHKQGECQHSRQDSGGQLLETSHGKITS